MPSRLRKSLALCLLLSRGTTAAADDAAFTAWKAGLKADDFDKLYEGAGAKDTTLVYKDAAEAYTGTSYLPNAYEVTGDDPKLKAKIDVNPVVDGFRQQGSIKLDLADGDKLTVESQDEGYTDITFTGGAASKRAGTKLNVKVYDSENNNLVLDYTDATGQQYLFESKGEDFVVPELKLGISGKLEAIPKVGAPIRVEMESGAYRSSWCVYMKRDDNNGLGTLSIPSLRLKLNLNKVHGDVI